MATPQEVENAMDEARSIAKDFAREDSHLGRVSLYCWVYEPKSERNEIVLEGDFAESQRDEIYDAGMSLLPAAV